jgi:ankyrin repeat protein
VYGLVNIGGDVNKKDEEFGFTALHFAVISGNAELVQTLLERNAKADAESKTGVTALHLACYYGNEAIIELLLNYGATKEVTDNIHGRYPIHYLALAGNAAPLRLLLEGNPHLAAAIDKVMYLMVFVVTPY